MNHLELQKYLKTNKLVEVEHKFKGIDTVWFSLSRRNVSNERLRIVFDALDQGISFYCFDNKEVLIWKIENLAFDLPGKLPINLIDTIIKGFLRK